MQVIQPEQREDISEISGTEFVDCNKSCGICDMQFLGGVEENDSKPKKIPKKSWLEFPKSTKYINLPIQEAT